MTMKKSARLPLEVNHLWPLITHSSPSRRALVLMERGSEPMAARFLDLGVTEATAVAPRPQHVLVREDLLVDDRCRQVADLVDPFGNGGDGLDVHAHRNPPLRSLAA
ncbi:MAG: hypothetical protein M3P30_02080 [Chloroflexota bacterium]|nr:hypothetical protein [Chloroflexota bacterium]